MMTGQMIEPLTPGGRSSCAEGPYKDLAIAIVRQAFTDYIAVLMKLAKKNTRERQRNLIDERAELESFFTSEWYEELCDIDSDYFIKMAQEKAIEKLVEQEKKRKEKKHEK